jgi:pentatricopeptide repeat protein
MDPFVGRTVGRYRILAELGRGGMGVVYRALDTTLNREVALKVLPADVVSDPERRRRFLREAQTASRLEHAHIGVIHEVGEADGVSFIAMELVRGESLGQLVARGGLTTARAVELATEVVEGLARAHETGIIHRDLKPANVMITEDGHAKIIDFGLAKLVEAGEPSGAAETIPASTDAGVIKGTASYMSPEQARGQRLDARSDLFSLGVMLYEMLSGRLPFQAPSYMDTLHAISHDPAPPLTLSGPAAGPEAQHDLQRLLDKCLEKDPNARYQTARDLVVDLRSARRRLDGATTSGSHVAVGVASAAPSVSTWRPALMWAVPLLVVVASGVFWWTRRAPAPPPPLTDSGKPSLAVLYFQNNTGSPQLDWLRTGLTDMVVTDLAQSPDIEVLGTDRLYQILSELKRQNDAVISFDIVQELARRAGVKHVLVGNYVKSGDAIRINITLQEAASGKIVTADRVEAANESSLFLTVDDLTRRVKAKFSLTDRGFRAGAPRFEAPGPTPGASSTAGYFRDLAEVTTSSTEAYRYYAQGIDLHQRGQEKEAEPLLEKAIEVDPTFALALTKLAVVENNLGHTNKREEYAKRAIDHADRLSPRERYYIEGYYYSLRSETMARAIASYKKAAELYADQYSARHNLATLYDRLERFDESIPLYEELRRRGATFAFTYTNLMRAYTAMGEFERARDVVDDYLRRNPNGTAVLRRWGLMLVAWGKYDEALATVAKADALDGGDPGSDYVRWGIDVLRDQRAEAQAIARKHSQLIDPYWKWLGPIDLAIGELLAGKSTEALSLVEMSATSQGPRGSTETGLSRGFAAATLLALGRPTEALKQAQRGLDDGRGGDAEWGSMYYVALAQSTLGKASDAAKTLDALTAKADAWPGQNQKRSVHDLMGVLALDRRDAARAVDEGRQADTMLRPRGPWDAVAPQVPIWFHFASALLAAGSDAEAATRFQRIVDSTERVYYPIEYVRSFYFLGQIAERRGDQDKAREYYQRFVSYWGDGDIDRDRVAVARKKLSLK